MAFKIPNPLTTSSPIQKHEPGHRFNLDEKLLNEKIDKTIEGAKNFKLDVPNYSKMSLGKMQQTATPTTAQNFKKFNEGISAKLEQDAYDYATRTTDTRGGEASGRAFGDYAGALGNSQYYGERDQFGQRDFGKREAEQGGIEYDPRGPYASRDVAVPFYSNSKEDIKKMKRGKAKDMQKDFPYLSNYADYVPTQINPMYFDTNSGAYNNQIRRDDSNDVVGQAGMLRGNSRLSIDNDQNFYGPNSSAHSYMGGYMHKDGFGNVSNRMFRPSDEMNDPFTQAIGPNGRNYRMPTYGASDQMEVRVGEAVGASKEAFNAIQAAINSGDFKAANEILAGAQSNINEDFTNTNIYAGTSGKGVGKGKAIYLNSPGDFFGGRVRDNLQYRTDQSNNSYNNEFLPDRNEQVDQEAMARLNKEKMRQMGIRMGNADYSVNFDTRGGQF